MIRLSVDLWARRLSGSLLDFFVGLASQRMGLHRETRPTQLNFPGLPIRSWLSILINWLSFLNKRHHALFEVLSAGAHDLIPIFDGHSRLETPCIKGHIQALFGHS